MKKNKNGFTLTEILVVIAIIGVILAIAIPSIIAVRKRINERLFESKKEMILIAAELYGKDKEIQNDTIIYVYTLVKEDYVDEDVKQNDSNCSGSNTENGCVINPVDDTSLNNIRILLKKNGDTIIAIWEGKEGSSTSKVLVEAVKSQLNCKNIFESNPCLYTGKNPDNYFYYSGVMWRILGVYEVDGNEVVKLITDDNMVWEANA